MLLRWNLKDQPDEFYIQSKKRVRQTRTWIAASIGAINSNPLKQFPFVPSLKEPVRPGTFYILGSLSNSHSYSFRYLTLVNPKLVLNSISMSLFLSGSVWLYRNSQWIPDMGPLSGVYQPSTPRLIISQTLDPSKGKLEQDPPQQ